MADAAFQQRIDDIRARFRVSDVARRRTKLRRRGGEWVGLCPFHREKTPSFTVVDVRGFYWCFGCGAHGDIIKFVQETEGVGFMDALAMIDGGNLPAVRPEDLARAREEDEAERVAAIADAERFWNEGAPLEGTPADLYLAGREIDVRPDALRYAELPWWRDRHTGIWGPRRPALMFRAEDLDGSFLGIQRIFLTYDGAKADMPKPKLSLGRIRGASIRLGRVRPDVIVTGGPEDGLTIYQRHAELATVYVSCGEGMLPFIRLPRFVRAVTVARQNDKPGRAAAAKATAAFAGQRRLTREIGPTRAYKDWNEEHMAIRSKAVLEGVNA